MSRTIVSCAGVASPHALLALAEAGHGGAAFGKSVQEVGKDAERGHDGGEIGTK